MKLSELDILNLRDLVSRSELVEQTCKYFNKTWLEDPKFVIKNLHNDGVLRGNKTWIYAYRDWITKLFRIANVPFSKEITL